MDWIKIISAFCILLVLGACTPKEENAMAQDRLLAEVFNKSLYLSALEGMVPSGSSKEDSTLLVNAYIERWVRESLLMHEAEKNIPKDLDIDELVRDYRASLIRHNYEKLIVELQLDSTINQEELNQYYAENRSQYALKDPIVRCHFIKIPINQIEGTELDDWWRSPNEDNFKKLVNYCNQFASVYMLEDSIWYKAPDIIQQLPKGVLSENNFRANRDFSHATEDHRYLLRINELVPKGEIAPISYMKNQATKVILHQRKLKLLDEKKEEIYERELRRNNIQIFEE